MRYVFYQAGKVILTRGIKHFTETSAVFEDGSEIHDIDLVFICAGFGADLDIVDLPGFKGLNMLSLVINAFILNMYLVKLHYHSAGFRPEKTREFRSVLVGISSGFTSTISGLYKL